MPFIFTAYNVEPYALQVTDRALYLDTETYTHCAPEKHNRTLKGSSLVHMFSH